MNLEIVCRQAVSWLDLDSSRKILLSVGKDNVIKLWNIKEILEVRIFSSLSLSLSLTLSELCVRCFFCCVFLYVSFASYTVFIFIYLFYIVLSYFLFFAYNYLCIYKFRIYEFLT